MGASIEVRDDQRFSWEVYVVPCLVLAIDFIFLGSSDDKFLD